MFMVIRVCTSARALRPMLPVSTANPIFTSRGPFRVTAEVLMERSLRLRRCPVASSDHVTEALSTSTPPITSASAPMDSLGTSFCSGFFGGSGFMRSSQLVRPSLLRSRLTLSPRTFTTSASTRLDSRGRSFARICSSSIRAKSGALKPFALLISTTPSFTPSQGKKESEISPGIFICLPVSFSTRATMRSL